MPTMKEGYSKVVRHMGGGKGIHSGQRGEHVDRQNYGCLGLSNPDLCRHPAAGKYKSYSAF